MKKRIKKKHDIIKHWEQFNSEEFLKEINEIDLIFRKIELNKWIEIFVEYFIDQKGLDEKSTDIYDNDFNYDDYYYKNIERNYIHYYNYGGKNYLQKEGNFYFQFCLIFF